jgi:hypothetical protein
MNRSPLGRKVEPVVPPAEPRGLKHVRGHIYVDEKGRLHNQQPTPCYSCGSLTRNPSCPSCRA